ncbi:MAG: hypothetical protein ACM3ML_23560 [Micromonosporaceae bacterium]
MTIVFPLLVTMIVVAVIVLLVRRDPAKRAVVFKRAGFAVMAAFTLFFGLFIVGETFDDPGGWKALGLVSAWLVPLAGIALVAELRPGWAVPMFAALITVLIGLSIWFAVSPAEWRAFENGNGPIRAIVTFVVAAGVAVLGLKRTAAAGVMLLVLGIVPLAVASVGSLAGTGSLAVAASAPVITGILYLLSAGTGRTSRPA